MKILYINNMGSIHGGAEAMLAELRHGLIARGHQVQILAGDEVGNGARIADYYFRSSSRFFYLCNPFAVLSLWRVLRAYTPDMVHLHTISRASPFILMLLKKYPTVLTLHDHTLFDPTRAEDIPTLLPYKKSLGDYFIENRLSVRFYLERLRFFFFRRFAKNINIVLTCSEFYHQCAKEAGFFYRVQTLHNGITLPEPAPITNWKNLLFVGRLDEVKGAQVLLAAFVAVLEKIPTARLSIVGTGPLEKQLKERARELGVEHATRFLGHQSPPEVERLYQAATLVVVPSLYPDNFPTVCIEAMAVGRVIIASNVGGIPELINDKKTGILVAPNNPQELAQNIIETLTHQEDITHMSEAGIARARGEFSAETYLSKTEGIYSSLHTSL